MLKRQSLWIVIGDRHSDKCGMSFPRGNFPSHMHGKHPGNLLCIAERGWTGVGLTRSRGTKWMLSSMNGERARVSEKFRRGSFWRNFRTCESKVNMGANGGAGMSFRGWQRPAADVSIGGGWITGAPRVGERSFQRGGKLIYYCRRTVARKIGGGGLHGAEECTLSGV